MLNLTDALFINDGGMRRCYHHPDDATLCVKVYRPIAEIPVSDRMKRWRIWRGLRFHQFNINHQEYLFWQSLVTHPRCASALAPYFPEMHGIIDTNMGPGLVEELLANHDGSPAQSLSTLRNELPSATWASVTDQLWMLADVVVQHALSFYDWNPHNFLLTKNAGGCYSLKVADLEGELANKEFIKLSRWSAWMRRRKLKRRIARFFTWYEQTIIGSSNEAH